MRGLLLTHLCNILQHLVPLQLPDHGPKGQRSTWWQPGQQAIMSARCCVQ